MSRILIVAAAVLIAIAAIVTPGLAFADEKQDAIAERAERALLDITEQRSPAELLQEALVRSGFDKLCASHPHGCAARPMITLIALPDGTLGQFNQAEPTQLYVNERAKPGTVLWNAIIVHELTHFLQWWFGEMTPASSCLDSVENEAKAHAVGNLYLLERGVDWSKNATEVIARMRAACEMGYDQ